jgi:exodeoxyribonuclease-3
MRIVTYNCNSIAARIDFVLDFLASRKPDLLCLQELKVTAEAFPSLAFAQAGYASAAHCQAQWNGVAVLVRKDAGPGPEIVQLGLPGQDAAGARLITVHALGLSVTSVYVPNGKSVSHPDFPAKLAWLDALLDYVDSRLDPSSPAVIGGDFNLCPSDLDSWDPERLRGHIFHTDAERERAARLVALGYKDLFREKLPGEQVFSWWDYRAGAFHKKQGLRIDLVYGTAPILSRTVGASVDRDFRKKRDGRIPSDHAPVIVDLAD